MKYIVKVKPGASQEKIIHEAEGVLIIHMHARPHDGEANRALLEILAKYFGVPKTSIKIVSGLKSRTKIVEF